MMNIAVLVSASCAVTCSNRSHHFRSGRPFCCKYFFLYLPFDESHLQIKRILGFNALPFECSYETSHTFKSKMFEVRVNCQIFLACV